MATAHDIVGQEWADRAQDLAQWAMDNLVNRKDLWGQYSVLTPSEARRSKTGHRAMTLPQKSMRTGADMVTLEKLTRHFASRRHRKLQIIGLHAKSEENTSRWFAIDIDCHDTDAPTAEDHALATEALNRRITVVTYDHDVRLARLSDHCAMLIEIEET